MSLPEVQQRISELDLRLRQLAGPQAAAAAARAAATSRSSTTAASPATGTTAAAPPTFADRLQQALAPGQTSAPALGRARTGDATAPRTTAGAAPSSAADRAERNRDADRAERRPGRTAVTGEQVLAMAKKHLGTPYEWGGESPGGFDCSGLMQWTYKQFGVSLPRVSTDQARAGRAVSPSQARPGDLVFFERGRVDHIGMYAGDGKWVVAPKTGDVVKIQSVDLSKATTIRRVLPEGLTTRSAEAAPARAASPSGGGGSSTLPGLPAAGRRFAGEINKAAAAAGIDPRLLAAVAWSESGFNPSARSHAGALGLMQIMPRTAAGLRVDPMDPSQALRGGARYLAQQLRTFGGREDLALAAYNAGPGAVRKHGGIPPYAETQAYVKTVLSRFSQLGGKA